MNDVFLVGDRRMTAHDPGQGHPERPARLDAVLDALEDKDITPAQPAPRDTLERIHPVGYVDAIEALRGQRARVDADTVVSERSVEAALLAAGAAVQAVEAIARGHSRRAFAFTRPPGHHAEPQRPMGFCLLSNVAIAAAHARAALGYERVLVVDWDVHHGNGTQRAFWDRDDVLFFSLHQSPLYPGGGEVAERGHGPGEGHTINLPLPAGCGDGGYRAAFDDVLRPLAQRFAPDLILVSAGYDAHRADPLGGMEVSTEGFASLCGVVRDIADEHADGALALVLEGGYDLDALSASVRSCVEVLEGSTPPPRARPSTREAQIVESLAAMHREAIL